MTGLNPAACHVYKPLLSSTSSQILFPCSWSGASRHSSCFDRQDFKRLGKVHAGIREFASPGAPQLVFVEETFEGSSADVPSGIEASDSLMEAFTDTGNGVSPPPELTTPSTEGLPETDVLKAPGELLESASDVISARQSEVVGSFTKATDTVKSTLSEFQLSGEKFVTGIKDKITGSIEDAESSVKHGYDDFNSSILKSISSVDVASPFRTGTPINNSLKDAVTFLKNGADTVLGTAAHLVSEAYSSLKTASPVEVQTALETVEKKAQDVSVPVSSALKQASDLVTSAERALGIDTDNPVLPIVVIVGGSIVLGTLYFQSRYGGYSGDLPPEAAVDLLRKEKNILLVDIRPQVLKDNDGVPDVRRASRSKLASIDPIQVERPLRSSLRDADDVNNMLTATIIRNLKNVKASTKVIIMDANGSCSKTIAKALRKSGVQNSYRLDGGFQAWTKSGLKSKSEETQTPLGVLKEDAEELVDELKPIGVLSVVLGSAAFAYALYEWEKTLQFIGVLAILQAVYRRIDSYESVDDFKADLRTLQKPFRVAYQGIMQATSKPSGQLELATSPSTTAVQDRVSQAAAKHVPTTSDPVEQEQNADEAVSGDHVAS